MLKPFEKYLGTISFLVWSQTSNLGPYLKMSSFARPRFWPMIPVQLALGYFWGYFFISLLLLYVADWMGVSHCIINMILCFLFLYFILIVLILSEAFFIFFSYFSFFLVHSNEPFIRTAYHVHILYSCCIV